METYKQECNGGLTIELSPTKKIILSATSSGGNKISLNNTVVSSGRVFCPKGIRGRVIEIEKPFDDGRTDHIFLIDFGKPFGSYHMGFQDLEYKNGSYRFQGIVNTACKASRPYE